jgi:1-acyl-sn-glycerol-3-phosphate acyltransferase
LLYQLFILPARLAIYFYCRKIIVNKKEMLHEKGPLLIAANHPNSFLDAIIIACLFRSPVYSLARGDAFAGKMINKILASLNMFPVYRISEGTKNLENNYATFDTCQKLFLQNKIVLIFSEGGCINEWHLRPLKKGTARLAINAWENNIPLKVLPLGINYSSFRLYGKNMIINLGNIISKKEMDNYLSNGRSIKEFNERLQSQLERLVYEIKLNDKEKQKKYFYLKQTLVKKIILFFPAIAGFIMNAPLYFVIHLIVKNRAKDHYDSIMTGLLFFLFPLYVLALTLLIFFLTKNPYAFLLVALLPFTAWSYLQLKK